MRYRDYMADRLGQILLAGGFWAALLAFGVLAGIPDFYLLWVTAAAFGAGFFGSLWDFLRKREFYGALKKSGQELDQAWLLPELLDQPQFLEGKLVRDAMEEMERAMAERIAGYEKEQKEYKDFVELWVHEIKLPIATGKLLVENNREYYDESMLEELDKIDAYTEQALFYARSNYVEKDYVLKKISLRQPVYEVMKKNRRALLKSGAVLDLHDLEQEVYSDSKWLAFILEQILANSLKYMGTGEQRLEWYARKEREQVKLILKDTGVGIPAKDLSRVFEKGFTGENGRTGRKSTGMGLYLCRKLCEKMGHRIEVDSPGQKGCRVTICYPVGSLTGDLFGDREKEKKPYNFEREL